MSTAAAPFVQSMRDAAASLRLPGSGLAWLDAARAEALRAFIARGLPDQHNELWKYTALRALLQRAYAAHDDTAPARPVDASIWAVPGLDGPCAVFVNGAFRGDLSSLDALPEGVTLRSLASALGDAPEPLRFLLDRRPDEHDDGFTLLNRALAADGVVLNVAAGVRVDQPLRIVHIGLAAASATAWHLRSLIEVGEGAHLDLIEQHVGEAKTGHLANLVNTINLRDNASLGWTAVQRAGVDATLLRRSELVLHDDARTAFHALELGGKLARHELRVDLAGSRSSFDSRGAFVLNGRRHADAEVLVTHRGRDTKSDALWRGVAMDRGRGVVHGRILVLAGADGADGGFYNKNLLLSPDAEIDTRPALEIYADEVKANHGATVGQLDENVLFYLRSRGIPLELAKRVLVRAFCSEAMDGIQPASLRDHCETLLADQLPELEA